MQLRAHGGEHPAAVRVAEDGERVDVELLEPAYGVAPGQAAVVYDGTRVVGSRHDRARPRRPRARRQAR